MTANNIKMIGGPFDGAYIDLKPNNPDAVLEVRGPLKFEGLEYDVDLEAGTATFVGGTMSENAREGLKFLEGTWKR